MGASQRGGGIRKPERWLLAAAVLAVGFMIAGPAISQDPDYHHFADGRTFFGVPNFCNVISNLAFLPIGIAGLLRNRSAWARILFTGIALVTFGSGYYHWAPSDDTLFWDRLPMTLVFMGLTAHAIGLWAGELWEPRLLLPLTLLGAASVVWWRVTGDLRPYAVAQFGPALVLIPAAVSVARVRGLGPAAWFYVLAKFAEAGDSWLYLHAPFSGHTLKHLLAALAAYWIYRWSSISYATALPNPAQRPARTGTGA